MVGTILTIALVAAGCVTAAFSLYLLALAVVDQPRPSPDLVRVVGNLSTSAFPSGHETTFTSVLGFLGYLGSRRGPLSRGLSVLGVAACLAVMAWARLYQGQHWLSELLGGFCLGCCWLATTILIYRRLRSSRRGS